MASILAIDLGKYKSVACVYQPQTGDGTFETIATRSRSHSPNRHGGTPPLACSLFSGHQISYR